MKKKLIETFALLIRETAILSVGKTSDWYTYQEEEPAEIRKLYQKQHCRKEKS